METSETPKTLLEAVTFFSDEDRAHAFFVAMRWPNAVTCPHCSSANVGNLSVSRKPGQAGKPDKVRRVWNCKACKTQFTAKVGTIFEDSPLPLSKWLPAVWLVVNAKNGISSHELGRALGITQKTAWFLAHRVREAIQRGGGVVRLDGVVEVDETFIGGLARNMHKDRREKAINGTGGAGKTAVMGLLQRHSEKVPSSKVVARVVPNTRRATLTPIIKNVVVQGSEIQSDALPSYKSLASEYVHRVVDHAEAYVQDGVHTNGLENFWSLLKRTIKGTHVHVAPYHLFRYLDDQTFRFNERTENDQGRFVEAISTAKDRRLTYKRLTGKTDQGEG